MKCRICGNTRGNKEFEAKEMMFGLRHKFCYFECYECGCLQIAQIPHDMSAYYPSPYYSFKSPQDICRNPLTCAVWALRNRYALSGRGILGRLIYTRFPYPALQSLLRLRLTRDVRILDVGCGSGKLLYSLKQMGFRHLLGVDPYIENDLSYPNGLKIFKKTIHGVDGWFDLVMFHNSFEHIDAPLTTLQAASKLLPLGGTCLVRTPIVDSWAWEHYGTCWYGIDAPRHFFIYSRKSIQILADDSGLKVKDIVCESTERQFWVSELYKRGVPLLSRSFTKNCNPKSFFPKRDIRMFQKRAAQLNSDGRGDMAGFYLEKIG